MKLSIVIPVFNEASTIKEVIGLIKTLEFNKEIIIVDDNSTDGTKEILKNLLDEEIKVIYHDKNYGKGVALRSGFKNVTGDIVVIQDADLEYDPKYFIQMIEEMKNSGVEVVYGSRFMNAGFLHLKHPFYITHFIGNKFLNLVLNLLYGTNISDMETCYKMFTRKALEKMELRSKSFEIEPEITVQLLKNGFYIKEVPISYRPRDYKQGKKIHWIDGFMALFVLLKYKFKKIGK